MTHHRHQHATPAHPGPDNATASTKAAVAAGGQAHKAPLVSAEAIRHCAYQKWESAGKPAGDGIQFWLEAEQELAQAK